MIDTTVQAPVVASANPQDTKANDTTYSSTTIYTSCPQPYAIIKVNQENYLDSFIEKDGVSLSMSYLDCQYVISEPTGTSNLALIGKIRRGKPNVDLNINLDKVKSKSKSAKAMLDTLNAQKTGTGYYQQSTFNNSENQNTPERIYEDSMAGPQDHPTFNDYMAGYEQDNEMQGDASTGEPKFEEAKDNDGQVQGQGAASPNKN